MIILSLGLVLGACGVVAVQWRWAPRSVVPSVVEDDPWLLSPEPLRRWSFGFAGVLADLYWLRTVQYYGRRLLRSEARFEHLGALLDVVTTLDPHFVAAYHFGAIFLALPPPQGAGEPERALALLDRGIRANPDHWRLLVDKGFIALWEMRDFARAAEIFLRASAHPAAPAWTRDLAAAVFARAGRREIARRIWLDRLEHAESEQVRENARYQLLCLQVEEELERLRDLVRAFRRERGRWPTSWQEMIAAGALDRLPRDPFGNAYELDPEAGEIRLSQRSPIILPRL